MKNNEKNVLSIISSLSSFEENIKYLLEKGDYIVRKLKKIIEWILYIEYMFLQFYFILLL